MRFYTKFDWLYAIPIPSLPSSVFVHMHIHVTICYVLGSHPSRTKRQKQKERGEREENKRTGIWNIENIIPRASSIFNENRKYAQRSLLPAASPL
jgi:hypothetical protein